MASVVARKNKRGEVTSYQVKWRLGGARTAPWQTEAFEDEPSAVVFRDAVNGAGQEWPPGWVKGQGFITAETAADERYLFRNWARECITHRTGVEERYRDDCLRELETYLLPTWANCDIRSADHFQKRTVQMWVNKMAGTYVWRGSTHKPMSPKTLKNLHGLLSSIIQEAVLHEPPLRDRNPCKLVALPRIDDDGVEDDDEDREYLEPEEVEGIVSCLSRPEDQRLVRFKYATGLRWGELTALAHRHVGTSAAGHPRVRVTRAWKRNKARGYFLGKPKTKASRRSLRLSPLAMQDLVDQGVAPAGETGAAGRRTRTGAQDELVFHNGHGERLPYSTFYERWMRAVKKAKEQGLLSEWKTPTLHDLRHSHAAALISRGHPLTYVQRRLGHESIQTTSDTYGHLLPEADEAAMATIDGSLRGPLVEDELDDFEFDGELPSQEQRNARKVYVLHLPDGTVQGWWKEEDRDLVAKQWALDSGRRAEAETWTVDWWVRQHGNGEKDVRRAPADRVQLWSMGPAVYSPDGVLEDPKGTQHEPSVRSVWDWEDAYTDEPALSRVEWREGGVETEAEAWGWDRSEVIGAHARACVVALQMCGLNPALAVVQGDGRAGHGFPGGSA
ncbi:site-specific integrase [Streptomyces sp. MBT49]|uniref:tyrosine-type recombinase/integrase n=1 Tax=unclassified Streptomyces TaxID=2593676 RepID=UPI00190B4400|nr:MULTISPECIES: site-specific integrase [unclassified Streptomyces]MBK3625449.1 site-specific integrase [Streptomyces sp. MBT49]MBK3633288.1 site-specific integrase [Streptomyces sp. MBT97]